MYGTLHYPIRLQISIAQRISIVACGINFRSKLVASPSCNIQHQHLIKWWSLSYSHICACCCNLDLFSLEIHALFSWLVEIAWFDINPFVCFKVKASISITCHRHRTSSSSLHRHEWLLSIYDHRRCLFTTAMVELDISRFPYRPVPSPDQTNLVLAFTFDCVSIILDVSLVSTSIGCKTIASLEDCFLVIYRLQ